MLEDFAVVGTGQDPVGDFGAEVGVLHYRFVCQHTAASWASRCWSLVVDDD